MLFSSHREKMQSEVGPWFGLLLVVPHQPSPELDVLFFPLAGCTPCRALAGAHKWLAGSGSAQSGAAHGRWRHFGKWRSCPCSARGSLEGLQRASFVSHFQSFVSWRQIPFPLSSLPVLTTKPFGERSWTAGRASHCGASAACFDTIN